MTVLHTYLKKVYNQITPKLVQSWITPTNEERGILRRLDYAYGFTKAHGIHIKKEDINPDGLLQILKNSANGNSCVQYVIKEVEKTCIQIKNMHCAFLVAEYEQFHKETTQFLGEFYKTMNDPSLGQTFDLESQETIYRMRKKNQDEEIPKERKDFFHVPFDKRYLMGTYRYSIPGYPSLYCSSSVYGAWEEMGRGHIQDYGYIAYKTSEPVRLLDLRWRFDKAIKEDETLLKYYILRLPIIIACSMQVMMSSDRFVPEYIFSQQIFQWLMVQMRLNADNTTMGVLYTSTKKEVWNALVENEKDKEKEMEEITNYALLAYTTREERTQYSQTLASKLRGQLPIEINWRISAKKSIYEILGEVQEKLNSNSTHFMSMKNQIK